MCRLSTRRCLCSGTTHSCCMLSLGSPDIKLSVFQHYTCSFVKDLECHVTSVGNLVSHSLLSPKVEHHGPRYFPKARGYGNRHPLTRSALYTPSRSTSPPPENCQTLTRSEKTKGSWRKTVQAKTRSGAIVPEVLTLSGCVFIVFNQPSQSKVSNLAN